MTSLRKLLPRPTKLPPPSLTAPVTNSTSSIISVCTTAPPYGERKGWVPRSQEDFNDGGAYPEIWVPQYPLDMGNKKSKTSNALAVQVDAQGKIKYDAILKQGLGKDKVIYSKLTDLLPSEVLDEDDPDLQRPDEEEVQKTTEETRQALEKIIKTKISAAMPVKKAEKVAPPQYIRYTPSQQGVCYNSGAKQRIIRMVEIQRDPMEPPRFKINKKIPRGPPSPPVPVMHSPTRKVTVKEQQEWKIPPCISNWKNSKGYTIPLDKRLASDGRGLQQTHINEKFSKLAEALYIADRKAREAVELRAQVEKKVAQKEKEKKEEHLRQLAQKAREERAGIKKHVQTEDEETKERDQLRYERNKERQRERNIARAAPDKRSKFEKQRERDISEKIALGLPTKTTSSEVVFDQRLFNQNKGMDSGFGDEDDYAVYDKPWRGAQNMKQTLYRPTNNKDNDIYGDDVNKYATSKEFTGGEYDARRDGPVQFEKEEDDPFGLAKFLTEAKKAKKRAADDAEQGSSKRRQ